MVKGGYQIINFNGVEFKKEIPMQLSNIYDKIEGTDKVILLSGLNVDGVDYRDVLCTPIVIGDSYVIKVFDFRIYISDDDIVRVEDENLLLYDQEYYGDEIHVSPYTYNRLQESFYGHFSTFYVHVYGDYELFTIIAADSSENNIICVRSDGISRIKLIDNNTISISKGE